jgi:predicted O-methyltransferase YrrM
MTTETILNLNSPWALGEEVFEIILKELDDFDIRNFVEFGSGSSSVRLCQAFKKAEIYSLEHDESYVGKSQDLKEKYEGTDRLRIIQAQLRWQIIDGRLYNSYSKVELPQGIDAVLIDGPPYWTRRGREACLYQVYEKIKIGGKVFLDDASRPDEMKMVKNWMSLYPNSFNIEKYDTEKGLLVLTKIMQEKRKVLSATSFFDNWGANLRHIVSKIIK